LPGAASHGGDDHNANGKVVADGTDMGAATANGVDDGSGCAGVMSCRDLTVALPAPMSLPVSGSGEAAVAGCSPTFVMVRPSCPSPEMSVGRYTLRGLVTKR
jgi:hypothetical protein